MSVNKTEFLILLLLYISSDNTNTLDNYLKKNPDLDM